MVWGETIKADHTLCYFHWYDLPSSRQPDASSKVPEKRSSLLSSSANWPFQEKKRLSRQSCLEDQAQFRIIQIDTEPSSLAT